MILKTNNLNCHTQNIWSTKRTSFFQKFICLAALELICVIRDLRSLLQQVGNSSLTRDRTWAPCIGV